MSPAPVIPRPATPFAALIAVVAWTGLALNVIDLFPRVGTMVETIWSLLDYFTITTNLLVALAFTAIAVVPAEAGRGKRLAGLSLCVLLVGIVNQLLLQGLYEFTPAGRVADILLHRVTPVLVPVFWLTLVRKGELTLRDPFLWALYPLGYFAYAAARGMAGGHYPYPFMDVGRIGLARTGINALVIAIGFLATAGFVVWLDSILAGRARPPLHEADPR